MGKEGWILSLGNCLLCPLGRVQEPKAERKVAHSKSGVRVCILDGGREQVVGRSCLSALNKEEGNQYSLICRDLNQFPVKFSKMSLSQRTNNDVPALSHTEILHIPLFYVIPSPLTINLPPLSPPQITQHLDNFL